MSTINNYSHSDKNFEEYIINDINMYKDKEYYNKNLFLHSYDSLYYNDKNQIKLSGLLKPYKDDKLLSSGTEYSNQFLNISSNHELLSTFNDISNQLSIFCFKKIIKIILGKTYIKEKLNNITDTNNYIDNIIKSKIINLFDNDMQKLNDIIYKIFSYNDHNILSMKKGIPTSLFNNIDINFYDTLINKFIYIYNYTLTFHNLRDMTDEDYNNYDKIILYYINNIIIRKSDNDEFINYETYIYGKTIDGFSSGYIIKLFYYLINYIIVELSNKDNMHLYKDIDVKLILKCYTTIYALNLLILFNIRIYLLSFTYKKKYNRSYYENNYFKFVEILYPTLLFARLSLSNKYFYGNQITGDILDYIEGVKTVFNRDQYPNFYKKLTLNDNLKNNKYICNLKDVIQSINFLALNVIFTTDSDLENLKNNLSLTDDRIDENQNLTLDEYYKIIPRTLEDDYQEYINKGKSTTTGGKKSIKSIKSRKSRKSKKSNTLITKSGKNKKTKKRNKR